MSYKQKRSLINYCHARQTTPNKLIKKMIRKYISNFAEDVPEEYYVTENQLDLFNDNGEEDFDVEFTDEVENEVNPEELNKKPEESTDTTPDPEPRTPDPAPRTPDPEPRTPDPEPRTPDPEPPSLF